MPQLVWVSDGELHPTAATKAEQSQAAREMEVLQVMPAVFPNHSYWCLGKRRGCLHSVLVVEGRDAAERCPEQAPSRPRTTAVPDPLLCFSPAVSAEGPIDVNMSEITMEDIHQFFSKDPSIKLGGHWKPSDCLPRWKVTGELGSPVSLLSVEGPGRAVGRH